jgi:hypothetical protein
MIGSETFIMVAFRCTDSSTPLAWRLRSGGDEAAQGLLLMTAQSMISPA